MKPENILAVLLGVWNYDNLPSLPAAQRHIKKIHEDLSGDTVAMPVNQIYPEDHSSSQGNPITILTNINNFIKGQIKINNNIELIIFYFSGHGLLDDQEAKYYLCVKETDDETLGLTAIDIILLLDTLLAHKKKLVLILDSCFSENIFSQITAKSPDIFIIASSRYNKTSKYPVGDTFSAFSERFINLLENGSETYKDTEYLSLAVVFEELKKELKRDRYPEPVSLDKNRCSEIPFIKNIRYEDPAQQYSVPKTSIISALRQYNPDILNPEDSKEAILKSYPIFISYYLKDLFAKGSKKINDLQFYIDFYKIIIKYLSFIAIKDLKDRTPKSIIREEDSVALNCIWNEYPTHKQYFNILKIICINYEHLIIKEFNKDADFLSSIDKLEEALNSEKVDLTAFRTNFFELIKNLAFFCRYNLYAVRIIEVRKGYYGPPVYRHEVSNLYGQSESKYDFSLQFPIYIHNGAIILYPKTAQNLLNETEYLNLWPLVIDRFGNDRGSDKPEIQFYRGTNNSGADNKKFYYESTTLKKSNIEQLEYADLLSLPTRDEWVEYLRPF
ncbi:caspase family protein [Mucilaginibacter ginsenosidivorax]|uniref:Peptidase C14 caspase domain-containing protein n=1 Tax=Mucilaginibacter ginsenosidivorax TaxID=862126 RepID=A0A5B8W7K6_9SPHI|nr:caspase family protein [Mucilaginibacter ginsenosidivorax]QEC79733.1 hypothetical protein FSB76_28660 [Mucilaginibacter ginsenosidivorax]